MGITDEIDIKMSMRMVLHLVSSAMWRDSDLPAPREIKRGGDDFVLLHVEDVEPMLAWADTLKRRWMTAVWAAGTVPGHQYLTLAHTGTFKDVPIRLALCCPALPEIPEEVSARIRGGE